MLQLKTQAYAWLALAMGLATVTAIPAPSNGTVKIMAPSYGMKVPEKVKILLIGIDQPEEYAPLKFLEHLRDEMPPSDKNWMQDWQASHGDVFNPSPVHQTSTEFQIDIISMFENSPMVHGRWEDARNIANDTRVQGYDYHVIVGYHPENTCGKRDFCWGNAAQRNTLTSTGWPKPDMRNRDVRTDSQSPWFMAGTDETIAPLTLHSTINTKNLMDSMEDSRNVFFKGYKDKVGHNENAHDTLTRYGLYAFLYNEWNKRPKVADEEKVCHLGSKALLFEVNGDKGWDWYKESGDVLKRFLIEVVWAGTVEDDHFNGCDLEPQA